MSRPYIPKYLKLHEVLPKDCYKLWKNKSYAIWGLFSSDLLKAVDLLREECGPVLCNNWSTGGNLQFRGYRPMDSKVGASLSTHKAFQALDLNFKESSEAVRQRIFSDPDKYKISCIEMDISWVHIDTRNHDYQKYGILKIYP